MITPSQSLPDLRAHSVTTDGRFFYAVHDRFIHTISILGETLYSTVVQNEVIGLSCCGKSLLVCHQDSIELLTLDPNGPTPVKTITIAYRAVVATRNAFCIVAADTDILYIHTLNSVDEVKKKCKKAISALASNSTHFFCGFADGVIHYWPEYSPALLKEVCYSREPVFHLAANQTSLFVGDQSTLTVFNILSGTKFFQMDIGVTIHRLLGGTTHCLIIGESSLSICDELDHATLIKGWAPSSAAQVGQSVLAVTYTGSEYINFEKRFSCCTYL